MDCSINVWTEQLDRVGLPLLLLIFIMYTLAVVIKWLAPRMDDWIQSYLAIQAAKAKILEESSKNCTELQTANLKAIIELTATLKAVEERLK